MWRWIAYRGTETIRAGLYRETRSRAATGTAMTRQIDRFALAAGHERRSSAESPLRRRWRDRKEIGVVTKPMTREAILKRINEIDRKFQSTEPWLHSMLAKLARERELLVEQANRQFKAGLKHEWR
jgi:hypothetical protein